MPRLPEAKVFFHDLATDTPLPKNLITGARRGDRVAQTRQPPGIRPGQHGYEFKTRASMSVYVYIYRHLHGMA